MVVLVTYVGPLGMVYGVVEPVFLLYDTAREFGGGRLRVDCLTVSGDDALRDKLILETE